MPPTTPPTIAPVLLPPAELRCWGQKPYRPLQLPASEPAPHHGFLFSPPSIAAVCIGKLRSGSPSGLSARSALLPDPSLPVQVAATLIPPWAVLCAEAGTNRRQPTTTAAHTQKDAAQQEGARLPAPVGDSSSNAGRTRLHSAGSAGLLHVNPCQAFPQKKAAADLKEAP